MKRLSILAAILLLGILPACDKSSDAVAPGTYPEAAAIMGLTQDHTLRYVVYDSVVSFFPYYSVAVDTTDLNLSITTGAGNTTALAADGVFRDLLTRDNIGVLHSGQIRGDLMPPDTLFFVPTPVIIPQTYSNGAAHTVISPRYTTVSGEERLSFLFFNYGYTTERTYQGRAEVILPTGSYNAYYFRSILRLDEGSADTLMTIDEYYADEVGLVKMNARAAATQRLIILLSDG